MTPEITRVLLIVLGLALLFGGLPIYRSTIKVLGFIVGAGYGVYLFSIFAKTLEMDPILIIALAGFIVLVLGILGTYLARMASTIMFFLAGGLVGVIIGKLAAGIPAGEIIEISGGEAIINLIKPEAKDLFWFLGGGFLFIISIDIVIMITLAVLGAGLIWTAARPMNLMEPDWIIPLVLAFLGIAFQESMRRKAAERKKVRPSRTPRIK